MGLASITLGESAVVYKGLALASDPSVIWVGDSYLMFYTDLRADGQATAIAAARSTDGVNWTPVFGRADARGNVLSGMHSFETVTAVMIGTQLVLYVSEYDESVANGLGASITAYVVNGDLSVEPFAPGPVITPDHDRADADGAYSPTVIAYDGGYVMYYVGHDYDRPTSVGVTLLSATSEDGITWTRSTEPVLRPGDGPSWASYGFAEPSVVIGPDGRVHLFYTALDGENRSIGYAVADHVGAAFEFAAEPLITVREAPGSPTQILAPSAIIENGELMLWYFSYDQDQGYQIVHTSGSFTPSPPVTVDPIDPIDPPPTGSNPTDEFQWVDGGEGNNPSQPSDPSFKKYPTCVLDVETEFVAQKAPAAKDVAGLFKLDTPLDDVFVFNKVEDQPNFQEVAPASIDLPTDEIVPLAASEGLWLF